MLVSSRKIEITGNLSDGLIERVGPLKLVIDVKIN